MSDDTMLPWNRLERWRSSAFLVGGVLFVVVAGFNAMDVLGGTGHTRLPLKQAVIGAGWFAATVGVLGLYPALVDRSRWLVRAGATFALVGLLGFALMGVVSLAVFAGVLDGGLTAYAPVFFPPVLVGSVLPFPLFGAASLRPTGHSRALGLLLPGPTLVFLTNLVTPTTPSVVLAVVTALALVCFGVGYLLRTADVPTGRTGPATGPAAD